MSKQFFLIVYLILSSFISFSQEKERKYVTKTFGAPQLITTQTTEIASRKSLNLIIQHRFGQTDLQTDFLKNFFGIDLVSNNRIGLSLPIGNRVMIGTGRTKYQKNYDISGKYNFLKQVMGKTLSFSSALYFNTTIMSANFQPIPDNYFYSTGEPFDEYKETHRLTFMAQLIIAKKFSRSISFQVAPAFIHRNLVSVDEKNDMYILPLGGRLKTGFFSSVIFEYAYIFDRRNFLINPVSIGWERETASHAFQIFISTSNKILDYAHYTNRSYSLISDGKFYLGFNINKRLWIKK